MLSPTAPVSTRHLVMSCNSARVAPYPDSMSAVTGTATARLILRTISTIVDRAIFSPSSNPSDADTAALAVATAR